MKKDKKNRNTVASNSDTVSNTAKTTMKSIYEMNKMQKRGNKRYT
jgi:hypothetical protein